MDEQYRKRVEERAIELIRSGEYDHLVIPDRGARLGRNNQDDRGLSYSIRDITGSEFRDLPQEPQAEDREYKISIST